jgi:hypothetical protein
MTTELIARGEVLLAEILRSSVEVDATTFFSSESSHLQVGVMSHKSGFIEPPHTHPVSDRGACATQQFFIVTRGIVYVDFFTENGNRDFEILLEVGDSILILDGIHSIRIIQDSRCVTIKQGPFLGVDKDRILAEF